MPIIQLLLIFVVVGIALWLINTFVPMDTVIKRLMNVAIIALMIIWVLYAIFPGIWALRVGPHP